MSTVEEIRTAITQLNPRDKALLSAELYAMSDEPESTELEAALDRGLADVEAGRMHEVVEVKNTIPRWTSKP